MKVLLTGASGFLGRHVLPLLVARGHEVHAVSSQDIRGLATGAQWHQVDLLKQGAPAALLQKVRPSHCLHLAWYAEPGKFWKSPANLDWVSASLDLLQAFHVNGGERIVMAGTCAEYDWDFGYCREGRTPLRPTTVYGCSKHATHLALSAFSEAHSLSSAWGRVFFLFGPHEAPARLVPAVITSLLRGESARCTHGRQVRDFLFVEDVAEAFVAAMESEYCGAFNICSSLPLSLQSLVGKIAAHLERQNLVQFGALEAPADDPALLVGSTEVLAGIGWSPRWGLDEALACTIDWWRQQAVEPGYRR